MKLEEGVLNIEKKLSGLDQLVLDFLRVLESENVEYVIVSGYVAILTGRSRGTEDIDVIIQSLGKKKTESLVERLSEDYWCINSGEQEIYSMLEDDLAVRFAEKDDIIPNFEVRFATDSLEKEALSERLTVRIDSREIFISPLELQIAYKLYLSSEKDFEDALHLFNVFEDSLEIEKLENYCKKLKVKEDLDELREA
ncbi:MAG: hypothetical protein ACLFS3_02260 [Candidatus Aenigmatarchaeota archaeon]